jgi:DNA-binding HxlR family transcriptional regulator
VPWGPIVDLRNWTVNPVFCTIGVVPKYYGQSCAIARGLEVLGGRWTLLIARELLIGPRRFTDLEANLPGIPSSLLGERLRELLGADLVQRRRLPPPAASTVYELTQAGRALDEVVLAIGRWGALFGRRVAPDDASRREWQLYALKGAFRPEAATRVTRTFEMHLGDQVLTAEVRPARLTLSEGSAVAPDLVVKTEFRTFMDLAAGRLALTHARKRGLITFEGGRSGDSDLLFELFSVRTTEVPVDLTGQAV